MPKVLIYTTPACIFCRMTKEFFKKNHVAYHEKDVSADEHAVREMVARSHQLGVPVIDIDGVIVVGFDEKRLRTILC